MEPLIRDNLCQSAMHPLGCLQIWPQTDGGQNLHLVQSPSVGSLQCLIRLTESRKHFFKEHGKNQSIAIEIKWQGELFKSIPEYLLNRGQTGWQVPPWEQVRVRNSLCLPGAHRSLSSTSISSSLVIASIYLVHILYHISSLHPKFLEQPCRPLSSLFYW